MAEGGSDGASVVSVRARVVEELRCIIMDGFYEPGDRLVERELCERLAVSRTSLREALRQMESEGLIDFRPNRGAIVRRISREEVLEVWELRTLVEGFIARKFALNGTESEITRFGASIQSMDKALKSRDTAAIKTAKRELWDRFAAGAHHRVCSDLLEQINSRVSFLWSSSLLVNGRPSESIHELYALLSAISARNPDAAEAAIIVHNEHARSIGLKGLDAFEARRVAMDHSLDGSGAP